MKREMLERKCDVCERRAQKEKGLIGNKAFTGWYDIQKACVPLGDERGGETNVCSKKCLLKFAEEETEPLTEKKP